ncbi:pyridoxal 5'-phosphate synthase glutaminase subunit PdxT [Gulosibacter sp. 10]|uniref:pyridoxal 5'-phosphate synthase glutaminase subunit PdxT n=1 Tax=Gulosibacter sp. 10 TaxID=1255570 RepID=UPI000B34B99F|nr:pyridoxal 5'-phosphate synthase glutaminase subunit PdxT [Gulosibacter sp. 10]
MVASAGTGAAPAPTAGTADGRATVGVLGLQGGVREHASLLEAIGARTRQVRKPADLVGTDGARVDALVLPGGESTVIDRLCRMFGLDEPIRALIGQGLPVLGTCAGLILLADRLENPAPGQRTIGGLDITVNRNAFGPQRDSAQAVLDTEWGGIRAAFIRAPRVVSVDGPRTRAMAHFEGEIVGVEQGSLLGASFHPELTGDATLHRRLLELIP